MPVGVTTPTVPRLAAWNPCPAQSWRTKDATEVLPLVPVTATSVSGWSPKKRAAISASSRRGSVPVTTGTSVCGSVAPSAVENGRRAALESRGDEAGAVGVHARQRGEQIARLDLPAVGREPRDRQVGPACGQLRLGPDQLTQSHVAT